MTAMRRMLVPVDLTAGSEDILRYGIAWAQLFDAELHVLHVVPTGPERALIDLAGGAIPAIRTDWMRDAGGALQKLVATVTTATDSIRAAVCTGQPAAEIERYAAAEQIDLIVMAARRHTAFARVALGSVAQHIVRRAPCPVVTVPPEAKTPRWLGSVRAMLMPTDLGDTSKAAFGYARELATCLGAALRVIHVVAPPWERQLTYVPPAAISTRIEQLTGIRPDYVDPAADVACDVQSAVRVGEPAVKIMAYAEDVHADLIVMATHSRHAFAQMLPGGVTQKVLRKAHCPVLTLSPIVCRRLGETKASASDALSVSA